MQLFDSHSHLQDDRIWMDHEALLLRAFNSGITFIVCCGSCEDDWERVSELAHKFPQIIPAFGIHPFYVSERSTQWLKQLENILLQHPAAAVGEIGIDHSLKLRNDAEQCSVFTEQLLLASRLKRPVSIHCRKAWQVLLNTLKSVSGLPSGGVIHSYSGSTELISELINYGLSLSFSGSVTNARNLKVRKSVAKVPIDKLLVETDSPDILPQGRTGMNEPSFLIDIICAISSIKGLGTDVIIEKTFENGMHIFKHV